MNVSISSKPRLGVFLCVLVLLAFSSTDAVAYPNYAGGCVNCHPTFPAFGDLHFLHTGLANNNCSICHEVTGDVPNTSLSEAGDRGCVGCHGRLEDAGNDSASEGLGAGLRQHHENSGVTACGGCHIDAKPANYTPVGENVMPPFYGVIPGIVPTDPATDNLDNDGDLLYDSADPDNNGGGGNSPPVVVSGGPYSGAPGVEIQFDASGTTDADDDTMTYFWDFGDDSLPPFPSQSPTTSHVYANAGTYTGKLAVTDGVNDPIVVDVIINVGTIVVNLPPTADAGGPYAGTPGQAVQLDASSSSDPDDDTLTYIWDFGDGSAPSSSSLDPTISHTYASGGSYTATVSVDDGENAPATATAAVEINSPPDVDAGGPYAGKPGESVLLDASGTIDFDDDALTYQWDFGDGSDPTSPSPNATASHTYANAGTYIATVAVSDGITDPVLADVDVEISDSPEPPEPPEPGVGDWDIRIPFAGSGISVTFEPFAGILLVRTTHENGRQSIGVGMEIQGLIFWMDITGSLYFGSIDHEAGVMQGVVFGQFGFGSIFFGELLR